MMTLTPGARGTARPQRDRQGNPERGRQEHKRRPRRRPAAEDQRQAHYWYRL